MKEAANVLVFEPGYRGHHLEWAGYSIDAFAGRGARVTLLTTPVAVMSEEYEEFLGSRRESFNVRTVAASVSADAIPLLRMSTFTKALHRLERVLRPDLVWIPNLDRIVHWYALRRAMAWNLAPVSGILFRLRSAYPEIAIPLRTRASERLLRSIIQRGSFRHVLTPDGRAAVLLSNWAGNGGTTVVHCVDPSPPCRGDQGEGRRHFNLPTHCRIVGAFGELDARKGVDRLIDAFLTRPPNPGERLFLAGRAAPAIRALLDDPAARLPDGSPRVVVEDRFLSSRELHLAFLAADVIAALHPRQIGSSAQLARAAAANRPLLGSSFGWIGEAITSRGLGLCCDPLDSAALRSGLDWAFGSAHVEPGVLRRYAAEQSVDRFVQQVGQVGAEKGAR